MDNRQAWQIAHPTIRQTWQIAEEHEAMLKAQRIQRLGHPISWAEARKLALAGTQALLVGKCYGVFGS